MGMDLRIWSAPDQLKILAGSYPLSSLLDERYREMRTIYSALRDRGFSIISWSQSRPAGPLDIAVRELRELLSNHHEHTGNGVILIGHSRGGLVGRKYLEGHPEGMRVLITIASPHHGTTLARWSAYLSPLASLGRSLVAGSDSEFGRAVKRIAGFLQSEGLKEMLPDSSLIASFGNQRPEGVRCVSMGGTSPDLIRVGGISLLEAFSKVLPDRAAPEELRPGLGDGLVSAASAVLPFAHRHVDFPLNHVSLLFDGKAKEELLAEIEAFYP